MIRLIVVLPLLLIITGCNQAQPSADPAALSSKTEAWEAALNAGDVDGIVALYASDARILPPNGKMATGSDAVGAEFGAMIDAGLSGELTSIEARVSGDIGWDVGTYTILDGDAVVDTGKFIETFHRGGDGEWRITNDIWNSDIPAAGGAGNDDPVAHARAAAPAAVSADATIVVGGEVAVEGSNGWTCMPETMAGDGAAICVDAVWGEMMAAVGSKTPFAASAIGISYMLLGDPAGSGVSNSDPYHADPKNADDYVETGPHLMVIAPKELLGHITDDPSSGGPYVMWKDTDYAHIMVPVE